MPTVVIKTVKPSGGDYTSLSAAEAGEQRDLTAVDQIAALECYSMQDTAALSIAGWTTDATRYIHIYTPASERHNGTRSPTKYRHEVALSFSDSFNIATPFTRVEGIAARNTSTAARSAFRISDAAIRLTDCIAYDTLRPGVDGVGYFTNSNGDTEFINCIALSCYDGWRISANSATDSFYNCAAVNCTHMGFNLSGSGETYNLKNCYAGGNTTADYSFSNGGAAFCNLTTCYSSDGTLGSTVAALTLANFIAVATGAEDLHLPAGSALRGAGTNLATDPNWVDPGGNVDIDGHARPGSGGAAWSVGPDQGAAVVTKTVKPSGGDYTSLSAWEAGQQADLVAADQIQQAECYSMLDAALVTFAGWTTAAPQYARIYTPATERHNGKRSPTKYLLAPSAPFGGSLASNGGYLRVEGLQVSNSYASTVNSPRGVDANTASGQLRLADTLIYDIDTGNANSHGVLSTNGNQVVANNVVVMNCGGRGFATDFGSAGGNVQAENCAAVNVSIGFYARNSSTNVWKNCYAGGCSTGAFVMQTSQPTATTCYSDTGTAVGTATIGTAPFSAATFSNVTAGSEDLSLVAGSALIDVGTNLAADQYWLEPGGAVDVIGTARPQGAAWDVGIFERIASTIQTLMSGRIATGAAVRGGTLHGILAHLLSGRIPSAAAVRGGYVQQLGAAIIYSGRIASAAALRGGSALGSGVARIASGRAASAAAIRGGASIRGVLASFRSGRIGSSAAVRGGAALGALGRILSGRIASEAAVRGGAAHGTGTGLLASGRVVTEVQVRGGQPRGVLARFLSGRIASLVALRGGYVGRRVLVKMTLAVSGNDIALTASQDYTFDMEAAIK